MFEFVPGKTHQFMVAYGVVHGCIGRCCSIDYPSVFNSLGDDDVVKFLNGVGIAINVENIAAKDNNSTIVINVENIASKDNNSTIVINVKNIAAKDNNSTPFIIGVTISVIMFALLMRFGFLYIKRSSHLRYFFASTFKPLAILR